MKYTLKALQESTVDGWMDVHFGSWALTLSMNCSLASNPSTQPHGQRFGQSDSSKKSKPQLQILNWSEPYSIGLSVVQLLLPVKEGTTNYSIQIVQYVPRELYLRKST